MRLRVGSPLGGFAVAALAAAIFVSASTDGFSETQDAGSAPLPELGVATAGSERTQIIGAVRDGEPGEVWAMARLPRQIGEVEFEGAPLEFGAGQEPQFALLRHTDSKGWQIAETPRFANPALGAYRNLTPKSNSAVMTPQGGGAIIVSSIGSDSDLLVRDPGGRFTEVPTVGIDGDPASFSLAQADRAPVAAFDVGGRTQSLVAEIGSANESVVFHDGDAWSREPLEIGAATDATIFALDATGPENAWLLARVGDTGGVQLFRREVAPGGGHRWSPQPMGTSPFAEGSPGANVSELAPFSRGADPLTVTAGGAWVDGSFVVSDGADSSTHHFTIFYDGAQQSVTRSWCDAKPAGVDLCDSPLGFEFSSVNYRSFAWAGTGNGRRVITNPIDVGGNDESNRGTFARLAGDRFVRVPGASQASHTGAFFDDQNGWLEGPVEVSAKTRPEHLSAWPLSLRSPLFAVAPEPGVPAGAESSAALAVGASGSVARYRPGSGWTTEYLLTSTGLVTRPTLRGVAWPERDRAYAVGDAGAMWLWRAENNLWERDPGAPPGLIKNLMDVAFDPANAARGYAVGREGTILSYEKSWEQVPKSSLPVEVRDTDFRKIVFAGSTAMIAAGEHLLVNSGAGWKLDPGVESLLGERSAFKLLTVATLPDGSALAAGTDGVMIQRDGSAPWRFSPHPLPYLSVTAAALFRSGGALRAVVSVASTSYPIPESIAPPNPGEPPAVLPPLIAPSDGGVLRQTSTGWSDEQRDAYGGSTMDKPVKPDPVLALLVDANGDGWALGGWNGRPDRAARGADDSAVRQRVSTAAAFRYTQAAPVAAPGAGNSPIVPPASTVNFAVGGHAECARPCADQASVGVGPDRTLLAALGLAARIKQQPNGVRFFLYTGGRSAPTASGQPQPQAEADRFALLLGAQPDLPTFPAVSRGDSDGGGPQAFKNAFAGSPAPLGSGTPAPGITPRGGGGSQTYYAFDSGGGAGTIRVIVIDNSQGSVDATQLAWIRGQLQSAKSAGTPAVVAGSRDLNDLIAPRLNSAVDGEGGIGLAAVLADPAASASAYFFERPEENRTYAIPAGSINGIPSFGVGTLGYRSELASSATGPSAVFGDSGILLAAIAIAKRDPVTNRAPVSVRLIPVIEGLSLDPLDGTLLRRSRPALFTGLGRRPAGGDRWGVSASPAGSDPYTQFPPKPCLIAGCSTRLSPEYEFTSSDPDIGDFVKTDPSSTNLRKPYLDASRKTVTDSSSGLFCAFNAGTTTVTIRTGGLSYSRQVTVQQGTVGQPCGTRPLNASRFPARQPSLNSPPPPPPPPPTTPPIALNLPVAPVLPTPTPTSTPTLPSVPEYFLPTLESVAAAPVIPPPPAPSLARPIPPTGGMARAPEKQRDEEVATEDSQAFAAYAPNDAPNFTWSAAALIVVAAIAGASISSGRSRGGGRTPVPARNESQPYTTNRRRPR